MGNNHVHHQSYLGYREICQCSDNTICPRHFTHPGKSVGVFHHFLDGSRRERIADSYGTVLYSALYQNLTATSAILGFRSVQRISQPVKSTLLIKVNLFIARIVVVHYRRQMLMRWIVVVLLSAILISGLLSECLEFPQLSTLARPRTN